MSSNGYCDTQALEYRGELRTEVQVSAQKCLVNIFQLLRVEGWASNFKWQDFSRADYL